MHATSNVVHRHVVEPVLRVLRAGSTPERLAWSLAIGITVGINPLLGSTTVLALMLAGVFRLNLVGSQLACHISYPAELILLPFWIRLGDRLFHSPHIPGGPKHMLTALRHHPWDTTRELWTWEWHALVVWACCAPVLILLLHWALKPALRSLLTRYGQGEPAAA